MFLELIATFAIGGGVAGVVLMANKLSRGRLPRWLMPVAAGLAMITFTLWSEYSWFGRTAAVLPETVEVSWSNQERQSYRPWTYIVPMTTRFAAVDTATIRTNDAVPDQRMIDVYLMARWSPTRMIRVVLDCAGNRRADLLDGMQIAQDGSVADDLWIDLDPEDPLLGTGCQRTPA